MAYGCRLGYNVNQTGCHVEQYTDLLVPGDFTIKTFGLQSVSLSGVFFILKDSDFQCQLESSLSFFRL